MDLTEDSGVLFHTTDGGSSFDQELSLSGLSNQTESGSTITLQLLEFKTLLHEVVEELQIQRDSKTLFEDQISKLVLEKQELEWEKESLQRQTETAANQHSDALMNMQMQFQAKIRNIEEVKGKYQIAAELKDKEMTNLKEELKSLQLLRYRMEKKEIELEQKLALQCRSKDSHLNQLGEVEKRFRALLRQCNTVKQAHEKLEQNVDDVMKINTKLTSANGRHIATTESLQKELKEVSEKLIKANMPTFRQDKTESLKTTQQHIQQLHLKLNKETEMNKKLQEYNVAVRAEKQEVMRSLQLTQQLLLNQTQAVKEVERELQTQREQNQALKQEHDMMQEKNKAMENNVAQLMESSVISKTSWDKKEFVGEETPDEGISSSDLPALQHSASQTQIQSKNCPEDTEPKQEVTGALEGQPAECMLEGQEIPNHQQQFLMKQPISSNLSTRQPANYNLSSPHEAEGSLLNRETDNFGITKKNSDAVSDLLNTNASVSDYSLQMSKTVSVPCSEQKSVDKPLDRGRSFEVNGGRIELNEKFNNDGKKREIDRETDGVKEEGTAGQKRKPAINQTDKADRQEGIQQPAEDTGGSKESKTTKRSREEGEDGTDKREETENVLENQTETWMTSYPTTEEKQQTDFIHAEPPQAASMSLSQRDDNKDINLHQPVNCSPTSDPQLSCHDEVQRLAEDASLSSDKESRISLSAGLFSVSTSSVTSSRLSCQTTQRSDEAPTSTAGLCSENPQEPPCCSVSTGKPSFRAQISKIEQFLNADRLHLHKRQRTDN
ncbi:coiled-coil domain-containing protein 73 [Halichoeres trimaculatus]|uniref:coiled-coil domain-containing protein 73 n=1 Tax=Halichoeres trimaculatus TaxID=147232 RepID=UPI003D9DB3AA